MEDHLRLAEARGSLVSPNSPVQDRALQMILVLGQAAEARRRFDAVRVAIAASPVPGGPLMERVHAQFPEYFPDDWVQQRALEAAVDETGQFDIDRVDDKAIDWKAEGVTPEEDEDLSRWISQRESGQVSAADLDAGWL